MNRYLPDFAGDSLLKYSILTVVGQAGRAPAIQLVTVPSSSPQSYWFQTGAPIGSVVKISFQLGCVDASSCEYFNSYLPDFAGDSDNTLIGPLTAKLDELRHKKPGAKFPTAGPARRMSEQREEDVLLQDVSIETDLRFVVKNFFNRLYVKLLLSDHLGRWIALVFSQRLFFP